MASNLLLLWGLSAWRSKASNQKNKCMHYVFTLYNRFILQRIQMTELTHCRSETNIQMTHLVTKNKQTNRNIYGLYGTGFLLNDLHRMSRFCSFTNTKFPLNNQCVWWQQCHWQKSTTAKCFSQTTQSRLMCKFAC